MNKAQSKIKIFFDLLNKWLKGKSDFSHVLLAQEEEDILVPHIVDDEILLPQVMKPIQKKDDLDENRLEALLIEERSDQLEIPIISMLANDQDQVSISQSASVREKTGSILLKSGTETLNLRVESWEVLCITLKLAKIFDATRIEKLIQTPDILNIRELIQIKTHIETIIFAVMASQDYLMSDLSISDTHPREAFIREDDPRRVEFIDRRSLNLFILFVKSARFPASVQKLHWKKEISMSLNS